MTTKNDQEHRQEKPRIAEVNPMHINQTLNIKSKPKTTNIELESGKECKGSSLFPPEELVWDLKHHHLFFGSNPFYISLNEYLSLFDHSCK